MYLKFYGLTKKPFHTTPDPNFLFLTPSHKEALGAMLYGIDHRKGFVAITGEVGVGKTTIVRSFLEQVDWEEEQIHLIYLYNPTLSVNELLKFVFSELEREPVGATNAELFQQLQHILIEKYRDGGTVVLLIDEAQNMSPKTLEHLRMLSNLETSTDKLLQIILIGQPELETLLQQHNLRQLRQRIAVWATIRSLSEQESFDYVTHRLVIAGLTGKHIFKKNALNLIVQQSAGIPRRLNILCDNALMTGVGYRKNPVTSKIVKEVIADIDKETPKRWWTWVPATAGLLLFILSAMLIVALDKPNTTHAVKQVEVLEPQTETQNQNMIVSLKNEKISNQVDSSPNVNQPTTPLEEFSEQQRLHQHEPIAEIASRSTSSDRPRLVQKKESTKLIASDNSSMAQNDPMPSQDSKTIIESPTDVPDSHITLSSTINKKSVPPEQSNKGLNSHEVLSSNQGTHSTQDFPVRVIRRGDTLAELMMEMYGSSDPELLKFVLKHNPDIKHVRKIVPGQRVLFPHLSEFAKDDVDTPSFNVKKKATDVEQKNVNVSRVILTKSKEEPNRQASTKVFDSMPLTSRVVREGDSLSSLIKSIYGSTGPERVKLVLKYNPHIRNGRKIFPGQHVIFPRLPKQKDEQP